MDLWKEKMETLTYSMACTKDFCWRRTASPSSRSSQRVRRTPSPISMGKVRGGTWSWTTVAAMKISPERRFAYSQSLPNTWAC
jgi:hypothetical protein